MMNRGIASENDEYISQALRKKVEERKHDCFLSPKAKKAKKKKRESWNNVERCECCKSDELYNLETRSVYEEREPSYADMLWKDAQGKKASANTTQSKVASYSPNFTPNSLSLNGIAEAVKKRTDFRVYENRLYMYNGFCYEPITPLELAECYRDSIDAGLHDVKSLRIFKELYEFLLTDSGLKLRDIDFGEIEDLAVLQNGIFNVRKQKLLQGSPRYFTLSYVKANFTESNYTPVFDEFLETVTGGDKVLIKRIWLVVAYICMQSTAAKSFFVFGLAPDSGKSLFGKFFQALFEPKFVSSIALNDMNGDFALAPIVGAALNISMDLPATTLKESAVSRLKMLTGDDLITINEKYVPQFRYHNRAKLVFGTNYPIRITGSDTALWNRCVYVPFDFSIPKSQQDSKLLSKLLREKDAIVSRALRMGKELIEANYEFPTTPEIEAVMAAWRGEVNDGIEGFLNACCEFGDQFVGEWTEDLYNSYGSYMATKGMRAVSLNDFRNFLTDQVGLRAAKFRLRGSENPRAGFRGISLKGRAAEGMEDFE